MDHWIVEQSHMVHVPKRVRARDEEDLMRLVRLIAETKRKRPIKNLMFTLEDNVMRVGFTGEDGKKRRFMRLRKDMTVKEKCNEL